MAYWTLDIQISSLGTLGALRLSQVGSQIWNHYNNFFRLKKMLVRERRRRFINTMLYYD
jgi:hypothetical protein